MAAERIKILYVMDYFLGPIAGTENQLLQLINGLDRARFEPQLAVFRPTNFVEEASFPCPVSVLNIDKIFRFQTLVRLLRLRDLIRESETDLVHILFNDASIVAPFFCRVGGARVIVSRRDMGLWYNMKNLAALKVSDLFVDRMVANSKAVREYSRRREGLPENKSVVIYNGHDEEGFAVPPAPEFRTSRGIGLDDPIVGMVANLYPIKRHADLVRAFALVTQNFRTAHLVFAGAGAQEGPVRELARSLSLERQVHFLGSVKETIPIIKHFSVGVLCSESEGLSNAIIEYMGCGKPTICTNVGGNPELVEEGYNGFLVELGDVRGLADRIIQLLSDPALGSRLGENARVRVFQDFSVEKMVNSYMNLYQDVLREISSGS